MPKEQTQFKKGHKPWNTGKKRPPFSEQWKKRIGDKLKGNTHTKGMHWKIKDTSKMKGHEPWNKNKRGLYKHSPEILKKISLAHKGKYYGGGFKKGNKINVGSKRTEETRRKMSLSATGKNHDYQKGEKNINWRGGIAYFPYPVGWKKTLKESIRQRDNYVCKICKITQEELNIGRIKRMSVHHIDYNKNNLNPDNLITLCPKCHSKTNFKREYWIKYFNKL